MEEDSKTLLEGASPEVKKIVERVLEFEKDNLHYKAVPRVKEELLRIIKEEIK